MPPRVARSSLNGSAPSKSKPAGRNPKKAQKRALNAFSIAAHENPDRPKIRRSRLGEFDASSHKKRSREEEDDEEEDEQSDQKRGKRRRGGGSDVDEGSDSEGNTWTMGHVDDDDDSDIDSDEAFGESDEEKFEGWTFRASSSNHKAKRQKRIRDTESLGDDQVDIDLDEEGSADGEEDEDDDLGEDAIDLATALDQYEDSEEEERQRKGKKKKQGISPFDDSDGEPSDIDQLTADGASEFSSDEDDEEESDRRAQLKDLISSLAADDEQKVARHRKPEMHESSAPSEFGVLRKIDLASFKSKVADPDKKRALKLIRDDKPSNRKDISAKLEAPLPKRQQDKLDRAAASQKANETLERWVDTVKHNRRAEHLSFPLHQPEAGQRMGESRLLPTTTAAPANDLESTIQSILQESGLSNGKESEEQIQRWEELQTNKLPLNEVMKRRAQLRRERELLFREEVRAKRIKKIKSKSYRRVHRKERERILQRERDALKADGVDLSEDEREYNDRRRAEERMGAKHRESKWAKGVKASGKAAWDEDARSGVTEMARRNEELRRRIEGKEVRDEDEDASDFSSEDDDDDDVDDDEDGRQILRRQLGRLKENPFSTEQSKLASMAFMQKAEAARKARNDEDIERLRKELAGEDSVSEDENDNSANVGRRKFGPGTNAVVPAITLDQSEFEERAASDEGEPAGNTAIHEVEPTTGISKESRKLTALTNSALQNPYLIKAKKDRKPIKEPDLTGQALDTIATIQDRPKTKAKSKNKGKPESPQPSDHGLAGNPTISVPDEDGWQTVTYGDNDDDDDDIENEGVDLDIVLRNQQLTATAFAGDNVEKEFQEEKKATVAEDDERIEENVLPGWGAWTGEGLSAREKRRRGEVTYKKKEGVAPNKRKDAKLDRVIINEKRVKANTKYLASQLPFPFETKEQYERSLRLPKGPEWTTKKTFQQATKPRVLVKQGIIRPMHKPLM